MYQLWKIFWNLGRSDTTDSFAEYSDEAITKSDKGTISSRRNSLTDLIYISGLTLQEDVKEVMHNGNFKSQDDVYKLLHLVVATLGVPWYGLNFDPVMDHTTLIGQLRSQEDVDKLIFNGNFTSQKDVDKLQSAVISTLVNESSSRNSESRANFDPATDHANGTSDGAQKEAKTQSAQLAYE